MRFSLPELYSSQIYIILGDIILNLWSTYLLNGFQKVERSNHLY